MKGLKRYNEAIKTYNDGLLIEPDNDDLLTGKSEIESKYNSEIESGKIALIKYQRDQFERIYRNFSESYFVKCDMQMIHKS